MRMEPNIELVPGTEIMTDLSGTQLVHAHPSAESIILIPQPTDNSHDPLNWTRLWKTLVVISQGSFVLFSVITNLSIAPLTPIYVEEWGKSTTEVALLTGATVLALGYANFIIVPCSEIFGRRLVLLVCAMITLGSCIWQATATSYNSFLGARILTGLGAAANESIMPVVVADMKFLHQRGKYVGLYFYCYFMGLFLGPIISGAVAERASWRWFFWACTIAQAINLVCLCLFSPETRRLIPETAGSPRNVIPVAVGERVRSTEASEKEPQDQKVEFATGHRLEENERSARHLGKGSPSMSQFGLLQTVDRRALRAIIHHVVTPVEIFFFPIVFWAAMSMGAAANALLCVNLLQSQALAAPPYNFTPQNVGFANFALAAGGVVGLAVAGPWSDWVAMRATKKNGGIREPEMRLPALLPFIAATILGMTVAGVGLQHGWPWEAVIILGFTLTGVIVVSIPTLCITYAIDCYRPIAGQVMVISTVCKNTFGFGMTYYINDWAAKDGFIPPLLLLMGMTAGFSLAGMILFIKWGKSCRRWTRNSRLHQF